MAEAIVRGDLGNVQMLVRPHPIHDNSQMADLFSRFAPRIVLQQTSEAGTSLTARSQDEQQVSEWVNTFRHADVVINLSSTVTVDAAIFDRPVINLDYDPEPGQPNQALVKDVNHLWTHFKPVAESGGVWLANSSKETFQAVRTYLKHPDLHREQRRWIAEYVCGYVDGHCGERMAIAIADFAAGLQKARALGTPQSLPPFGGGFPALNS
jgi:CDP-glycerol glycerophosphotransferase (TagB/SpsB family)